MKFPAISVIIPLYNAEQYIGECLESILAQTFQDFEVIVVDDCSTDKSVEIVQGYALKFGGRLRLAKMKKNSGSGTAPRNFGLTLSRGEYIFFLDNDDTITPTAFAELYSVAKEFNADVVSCEKYYLVPEKFWNQVKAGNKVNPYSYKLGDFVNKPTLITDNLAERVKRFHQRHFLWNVWAQLIRRDFIFENQIKFVGVIADDVIFIICEICAAERYVLVPNVINYYRIHDDSFYQRNHIRPDTNLNKHLHNWITMIKCGIEYLDDFLNEQDFFSKRPDLKYALFDIFVDEMFRYVTEIYLKIPAYALDEILRKEFGNKNNLALTTFLFSSLNVNRLQLIQSQQRIAELEKEIKRLKSKE